jgi:hypothetical protein
MKAYAYSTRFLYRFAIAVAVAFLLTSTAQAQTIPLKASRWLINPKQANERSPEQDGNAVAFDFSKNQYTGYLVTATTGALHGDTLTATLNIQTAEAKPGKRVRFIPKPNGDCIAPATVRFYFQTGELYNDVRGTRWWSNQVSWELKAGVITLSVDLSPKNFSGTFGEQGSSMPDYFWHAANFPTYIGLTFGGNCHYGHGVVIKKGAARFELLEYSTR